MEETGHEIRHYFGRRTIRELKLVEEENGRRLNHVTCEDEQRMLVVKNRTAEESRAPRASQRLKLGQSVEHEGVEVPATLLAVGEAVGEQVDQHALPRADFAMQHQATRRVELHGLFVAGQHARQGRTLALLLLDEQRRPEAAWADILGLLLRGLGATIGTDSAAYLVQTVAVFGGRLIVLQALIEFLQMEGCECVSCGRPSGVEAL